MSKKTDEVIPPKEGELRGLQPLTDDRRRELEAFLRENMGLVCQAWQYYGGPTRSRSAVIDAEDLKQEVFLAFMRTFQSYNSEKASFATYFHLWARQFLQRAVDTNHSLLVLPAHLPDEVKAYTRAQRKLSEELGRQPNTTEIQSRLGWSSDKFSRVTTFLMDFRSSVSLDQPVGESGGTRFDQLIAPPGSQNPEERANQAGNMERISELISRSGLTEREKRVIERRCGPNEESFKEIARRLGVTDGAVSQSWAKAVSKLRKYRKVKVRRPVRIREPKE